MTPLDVRTRSAGIAAFYGAMTPADLARLGDWYADDARFVDPFNDLRGRAGIHAVLDHMFRTLDQPRFEVLAVTADGDTAWLTWDFHFRRRGSSRPWHIHGASRLRFGSDGRVAEHIDYWDAAAQLYERLPLLGPLLRLLRRKLATPLPSSVAGTGHDERPG